MVDISQFDPDKLINNVLPQLKYELRQIVGNGSDPQKNIAALDKLRISANNYYNLLSNAYDDFSRDAKFQAEQIAEKQAIGMVRENANRILEIELQKAVEINQEFKHPIFYQPLLNAVYNPKTIQVSLVNGRPEIKIDLNTTAGHLRDWAEAVKNARKIFTRRKKTPEPMRSHMWREKFYGAAREGRTITRTSKKTGKTKDVTEQYIEKYWDTIALRFENCQSPAPYWHILNYGSPAQSQEGGSSKGGTPYPINSRTNFVGNTINFLRSFYQRQYRIYYTKVESEIALIQRKYQERFKQWDILISVIDRAIAREQAKLDKNYSGVSHVSYETELRYLENLIGEERLAKVNQMKLARLAQGLQRGEDISKRLNLGGGVRIRTINLLKKYRGY